MATTPASRVSTPRTPNDHAIADDSDSIFPTIKSDVAKANGSRSAKSKGRPSAVSIVRLDPADDEDLGDDVNDGDDDVEAAVADDDGEEVGEVKKPKSVGGARKARFAAKASPKVPASTGKRGRPSKSATDAAAATAATPRKRGRPSKGGSTAGTPASAPVSATKTSSAATPSTGGQRKRKRSDGNEGAVRKSARTAASSAAQQITELSKKRAKAPVAQAKPPAARGRKPKAATTATNGRMRGKTTAAKPEYEVETILESRHNKKSKATEYLVKWKGYSASDNTWEPGQNLTHCAQALKAFNKGGK